MHGNSANHGVFGLMLLGLVATTMMFLTFAMTGMHMLDAPGAEMPVAPVAAVRDEEQRLRDLWERIARLEETRPASSDQHLASETDVAQLRQRIRSETEHAARLKSDLADASRVSVGHIFGSNRGGKSVQYVECVDGAAIIQPRGTRFAQSNAEGLAQALSPGHVALLVRPGAFATFLAVRAALSRKPELKLGYLPVEHGWQLDYGAPGG